MAILKLIYSNDEKQVIKTYDKSYYDDLSLDEKMKYVLYEESGNHYYIFKNDLNFSTKESKNLNYDNLLKLIKIKRKDIKINLKENGKIFHFNMINLLLNVTILLKKLFNFLEEGIIPMFIVFFLGYCSINHNACFNLESGDHISYFVVLALLSLCIDKLNDFLTNIDNKMVNKMNVLLSDYKSSINIKEVSIIENEVNVDNFKLKMDNELKFIEDIKFKIEQNELIKKDFSK